MIKSSKKCHVCFLCGRELKNEVSIARGYGAICYKLKVNGVSQTKRPALFDIEKGENIMREESTFLTSVQIEHLLSGIRNEYSIGPSLSEAIDRVASQAIATNLLAEQNKLLQIENDRLRTKLLSIGISGF